MILRCTLAVLFGQNIDDTSVVQQRWEDAALDSESNDGSKFSSHLDRRDRDIKVGSSHARGGYRATIDKTLAETQRWQCHQPNVEFPGDLDSMIDPLAVDFRGIDGGAAHGQLPNKRLYCLPPQPQQNQQQSSRSVYPVSYAPMQVELQPKGRKREVEREMGKLEIPVGTIVEVLSGSFIGRICTTMGYTTSRESVRVEHTDEFGFVRKTAVMRKNLRIITLPESSISQHATIGLHIEQLNQEAMHVGVGGLSGGSNAHSLDDARRHAFGPPNHLSIVQHDSSSLTTRGSGAIDRAHGITSLWHTIHPHHQHYRKLQQQHDQRLRDGTLSPSLQDSGSLFCICQRPRIGTYIKCNIGRSKFTLFVLPRLLTFCWYDSLRCRCLGCGQANAMGGCTPLVAWSSTASPRPRS